MDWVSAGARIRKQREYLGLTREQFAEQIDVTPKFCADIELGVKGMSIPTLCKISKKLLLSTDYILFGTEEVFAKRSIERMLERCTESEYMYAEKLLKVYLAAIQNNK